MHSLSALAELPSPNLAGYSSLNPVDIMTPHTKQTVCSSSAINARQKLGRPPNTMGEKGAARSLGLQSFARARSHISFDGKWDDGTIKILWDSFTFARTIFFSGVDKEFNLFITTAATQDNRPSQPEQLTCRNYIFRPGKRSHGTSRSAAGRLLTNRRILNGTERRRRAISVKNELNPLSVT